MDDPKSPVMKYLTPEQQAEIKKAIATHDDLLRTHTIGEVMDVISEQILHHKSIAMTTPDPLEKTIRSIKVEACMDVGIAVIAFMKKGKTP